MGRKRMIPRRYILIIMATAGILVLLQICRSTIAGSRVDWISQHTAIADYFRKRFYQTHNLFPQYAAELGGGQNIYYFAYYGLYNPLYMLSWLFPFLSMETWFQIIGFFTHSADGIICFLWLKEYAGEKESFLGSFMLMCSSAVVYHTSTQVMFVEYLPFLLLMMIGVDIRRRSGKGTVLTAGTAGLILSSFYFAPASLLCVGIYIWAKEKKDSSIKKLMRCFAPVFLGILLSAFYLVPTACALFSGRGGGKTFSWKELLLPDLTPDRYLYHPYGLGVTAMAMLILGIWICRRKCEERKIAAVLMLLFIFPIFSWILNGGLYARSKIFLPFLPLIFYLCARFFQGLGNKDFSGKQIMAGCFLISWGLLWTSLSLGDKKAGLLVLDLFLCMAGLYLSYRKRNCTAGIYAASVMFCMCAAVAWQSQDLHVTKKYLKTLHDADTAQNVWAVLNDDPQLYRMEVRGDSAYEKDNQNRIWMPGQNLTTSYSSLSNPLYTNFRKEIGVSKSTRNCFMQDIQENPLFLRFMGVKYLVGENTMKEWRRMQGEGQAAVYKNDKAAPLFYLTDQTAAETEFAHMPWQEKQLFLLKQAVVPNGGKNAETAVSKRKLSIEEKTNKKNFVKNEENGIQVRSSQNIECMASLEEGTRNGEYVFIEFQVKNHRQREDVSISIEGVKNKLSARSTDYYNENERFHYTLSVPEGTKNLSVTFGAGNYEIKNLNCWTGRVNEEKNQSLYQIRADLLRESSGDGYKGTIKTEKERWLISSLPYDKGFQVFVDGKAVKTELVNGGFLGAMVPKGTHDIEIRYRAPGSMPGVLITCSAILAGGIWRICRRKQRK